MSEILDTNRGCINTGMQYVQNIGREHHMYSTKGVSYTEGLLFKFGKKHQDILAERLIGHFFHHLCLINRKTMWTDETPEIFGIW